MTRLLFYKQADADSSASALPGAGESRFTLPPVPAGAPVAAEKTPPSRLRGIAQRTGEILRGIPKQVISFGKEQFTPARVGTTAAAATGMLGSALMHHVYDNTPADWRITRPNGAGAGGPRDFLRAQGAGVMDTYGNASAPPITPGKETVDISGDPDAVDLMGHGATKIPADYFDAMADMGDEINRDQRRYGSLNAPLNFHATGRPEDAKAIDRFNKMVGAKPHARSLDGVTYEHVPKNTMVTPPIAIPAGETRAAITRMRKGNQAIPGTPQTIRWDGNLLALAHELGHAELAAEGKYVGDLHPLAHDALTIANTDPYLAGTAQAAMGTGAARVYANTGADSGMTPLQRLGLLAPATAAGAVVAVPSLLTLAEETAANIRALKVMDRLKEPGARLVYAKAAVPGYLSYVSSAIPAAVGTGLLMYGTGRAARDLYRAYKKPGDAAGDTSTAQVPRAMDAPPGPASTLPG